MIRASTLVKTAALAMMMGTSLLFPAAAQQMATATTGPNYKACDTIKDPGLSVQCYHEATIAHYKGRIDAAERRGAAADARSEVADAGIAEGNRQLACIAFIREKRKAGVVLDPARMNREKGCAYAKELGMQ